MQRIMAFGPVGFAWRLDADDRRWQPFLTSYAAYLRDDDKAPSLLTIDALIGPAAAGAAVRLPNSLIRARAVSGRDFDLGDGLVRGVIGSDGGVRCTIAPVLLHGVGLRVLEQFFYLLFHEAALAGAAEESAAPFLIHGSAVLDGERAHVFCGPSESGKSTAAENSRPRPILTDECVAIGNGPDGLCASGTPVNPFCQERRPGSGTLAGVHLIEQAPTHARLPIARAAAVPRLTAEIMVPLRLLETSLAVGMGRAIDRSLRLCSAGIVDRLRLRPDGGFWALLAPGGD